MFGVKEEKDCPVPPKGKSGQTSPRNSVQKLIAAKIPSCGLEKFFSVARTR